MLSVNIHAGPIIENAASVLNSLADNAVPPLSLPAVQVQDEQFARVRVLFETGSNQGYQFKTHPNIDKQLYASNVLGLKDSDRPFPTGSALPILKWRMQVHCALLCVSKRLALPVSSALLQTTPLFATTSSESSLVQSSQEGSPR